MTAFRLLNPALILGCTAKDAITGFTGTVGGVTFYLTGCAQVLVMPKVKADGSPNDGRWFDETRLARVGDEVLALPGEVTPPGEDAPAHRRHGACDPAPIK